MTGNSKSTRTSLALLLSNFSIQAYWIPKTMSAHGLTIGAGDLSILSLFNFLKASGLFFMVRENTNKLMLCSKICKKFQVPTEQELRNLNGLKCQILEMLRAIIMPLNLM